MPVAGRIPLDVVPGVTLRLLDRNGALAPMYSDDAATASLANPIALASIPTSGAFVRYANWGWLKNPAGDWPTEGQFGDAGVEGWFGFLDYLGGAYQAMFTKADGTTAGSYWIYAMRLTTPLARLGGTTFSSSERNLMGVGPSRPSVVG